MVTQWKSTNFGELIEFGIIIFKKYWLQKNDKMDIFPNY